MMNDECRFQVQGSRFKGYKRWTLLTILIKIRNRVVLVEQLTTDIARLYELFVGFSTRNAEPWNLSVIC